MRALLICILAIIVPLLFSRAAAAQTLSEEVNLAIERGIHTLLLMQQKDGTFKNPSPGYTTLNRTYPMGVSALAVYALLKSGISRDDPVIRRALPALREMPFRKTYGTSVLIMALDALHDPEVRPWIAEAAGWLEDSINLEQRLWGYPARGPDLSNTQYAVLALWLAERNGYEVHKRTWTSLLHGAMALQSGYGGFAYNASRMGNSRGSMTTAGIAVITLALKALEDAGLSASLKKRADRSLEEGWKHLNRCFTTTGNFAGPNGVIHNIFPADRNGCYHFYYLYGLERVAALSNRTTIGGHRWYNEGARSLLSLESPGGGWGDLVNTSFALLFLRRATFSGMSHGTVSTGTLRAETWRYITAKPANDWAFPGFEDSGWKQGAACLGNFGAAGGAVRTEWLDGDVWMRREFDWREKTADAFRLFALHDDEAEIYVNGVLAADLDTWSQAYKKVTIRDEARAAVKMGLNVLAVHCHNIGGNQIVDVRLRDIGALAERAEESEDEAYRRWWQSGPRPEVPFIRRWLVLGPLANPDDSLLLEPLQPDPAKSPPAAGSRCQGSTWRLVRSRGDLLDFEAVTRTSDRCLFCALTFLKVERDVSAVLWIGADDGFRVEYDGRVLITHHVHSSTGTDGFGVPVRLTAGIHTFLFKVDEWAGASSLRVRIAGEDGAALNGVFPVIDPDLSDWGEVVAAHPDLFTLEQLLRLLPLDTRSRLDFAVESDADRVSLGRCRIGYPLWLDRHRPKEETYQPNPGAGGVLAVQPVSAEVPALIYRKVRIPAGREAFEVTVSAEAHKAVGKSGFVIRLGVYDGELKWLAEETISGGDKPHARNWRTVSGGVAEYAGREVLLIVECAPDGDGQKLDIAFIDDASLR